MYKRQGVASSRGLPCPILVQLSFKGDYLARATIYYVITVNGAFAIACMSLSGLGSNFVIQSKVMLGNSMKENEPGKSEW